MTLFDTSFLIDLVNEDFGAVQRAREVDRTGELRALSAITVEEYLYGVYYPHLDDPPAALRSRLEQAEDDLNHFEILPCDREVARVAAEVEASLARRGTPLELADVLIAATALRHRLSLVTRNAVHFRRVPGITVEKY